MAAGGTHHGAEGTAGSGRGERSVARLPRMPCEWGERGQRWHLRFLWLVAGASVSHLGLHQTRLSRLR